MTIVNPLTAVQVDPDIAWRKLTSEAIYEFGGMSLGEACASGSDCLDLCDKLKPDVVIIELLLPDMDGFDLIDRLRSAHITSKMVLLTNRCDEVALYRAEYSNIEHFVWKVPGFNSSFRDCLSAITENRPFFSREIIAERRRLHSSSIAFFKILSRTEQELLPYFGRGMSDGEIAELIHARPLTIKWHRRRILSRLGLHRTADLILWVQKKGFIVPQLPAPPCLISDSKARLESA